MVFRMSYKMQSGFFENNEENKEAETDSCLWLLSVDSWVRKKEKIQMSESGNQTFMVYFFPGKT